MHGPLEEVFNGISTRYFDKGLNEILLGPGPLQELTFQDQAKASDSMSLGSPQDRLTRNCKKTLTKIFMPGPVSESHKTTAKGHAVAGADITRS